jgi:hypothetical protein
MSWITKVRICGEVSVHWIDAELVAKQHLHEKMYLLL